MNKLQLYTKEAIRCITRDVLQVKKVLISYLKTGRVQYSFGLVYQPQTLFARKVLACVKRIPAGKTVSYAWIAGSIGFPKAARAVGTVLAKNQLPLFIPCHRVVKKNKKIGNFSAGDGFKLKEKLVDLEKTRRACSV